MFLFLFFMFFFLQNQGSVVEGVGRERGRWQGKSQEDECDANNVYNCM
jgi:hypothetical protein